MHIRSHANNSPYFYLYTKGSYQITHLTTHFPHCESHYILSKDACDETTCKEFHLQNNDEIAMSTKTTIDQVNSNEAMGDTTFSAILCH